MNPRAAKQDEEITDPFARKIGDWCQVTMRWGFGVVLATLAIVGVIWVAMQIVPAYRDKIISEGKLAAETAEALKQMVVDFERRRAEFSRHETEDIKRAEATGDKLKDIAETLKRIEKNQTAAMEGAKSGQTKVKPSAFVTGIQATALVPSYLNQ